MLIVIEKEMISKIVWYFHLGGYKMKEKALVRYCLKYQKGGRINNAVKNIGWALNHCEGTEEDVRFAVFLLKILINEV